jgi:carboxyl-terminal processing protease
MKKNLLWIVLVLVSAVHAASFDPETPFQALKPLPQQSQAAHLAAQLLVRYHYKAMPLDDAMSRKIFDHYLKSLDSEKLFFVKADIDQFDGMRTRLDDAIIDENLGIPFAIFNLYARRANERFTYARRLLKDGFDFSQKEGYQYTREKEESWPKSDDEMRDLWRKRVKNDWLRLRLAGKDDKSIVETLDKRYENSQKRIARAKSEDAFQVFMNAYTMAIEPHTAYMGLRAAEDFDIAMKLSLVGIGAALSEKDDYTMIRDLIAGGPAILSGQLKVGDRILGVAQGEGGVMTDIQGWRLDDSVAIIRGAADSVVRLDILPADAGPDGKHKLISLVRKKITLEEQAAQKSVLTVRDGEATRRVGVIALPTFYQDFEARSRGDRNFKSATRDVARLLDELKKDKVDSVLVDLRNNGGGSLSEAIELTGLFIGKGPVVQQRDAQGKITVEGDSRAGAAWDGPLGVLINRGSASASEIFAAAIQDYDRGVVVGEPSFGKGTVQSVINLDRVANSDKPKFGELTLTVAQFFRINGSTTQMLGVKPDIGFPAVSDAQDYGESSFGNALPWIRIKPAVYSPAGDLSRRRPILLARHQARIKNDKDFQAIEQDISEFNRLRKVPLISLNEAERRREVESQEARLASRETQKNAGKGAARRDDGLQADERKLSNELAVDKELKNAKDVYLNEAVHILSDDAGLLGSRSAVTERTKPRRVPVRSAALNGETAVR